MKGDETWNGDSSVHVSFDRLPAASLPEHAQWTLSCIIYVGGREAFANNDCRKEDGKKNRFIINAIHSSLNIIGEQVFVNVIFKNMAVENARRYLKVGAFRWLEKHTLSISWNYRVWLNQK